MVSHPTIPTTHICFEYDPETIVRDQWLLLIRSFPNIQGWERSLPTTEKITDGIQVIQAVDQLPNIPLIILSPQQARYIPGTQNLAHFNHPQEAIYYFGSDNDHLRPEAIAKREYQTVYIPIAEQLWSPQAAGIVVYDRFAKMGMLSP